MEKKPNLLIVDDDLELLHYIKTILGGMNLNLIQASSGREALEKIRGKEIALAVIDVRMPVMDGFALAKAIGNERPGEMIPIIFLTGDLYIESNVYKGYSSGAVDYIFKPVDNEIFRSKIRVFLELYSQKQKIIANAEKLKQTAQKLIRLNTSLQASKEKYRSYVDSAPDGVFITDNKGKYLEVNEAACAITGYSKDELLTMSISDLLGEESLENSLEHFRKVKKSGIAKADLQFKHKNGYLRWWTVEAVKLSDKRFLGFTKDITQRVELECSLKTQQIELAMQNEELSEALTKAEVATRKYSELYDFAPSGYFTLSQELTILELNHSGARILGKGRAELVGSWFGSFVSVNSMPAFNSFLLTVFNKKTKETCELMVETGSSNPTYVYIECISVNNGKQCLMNVADITMRVQTEKLLKFSEDKYKTLINASPDGILITDLDGMIMEVSDIGLELIGADTKDELVGTDIYRFLPTDEKNVIKEIIDRTMNEGLVQNIELKIRKKNQSLFASEISATLIQGPKGAPVSFMFIIRDISQRKKMEAKQIHADRMANLGEMASGIAHEINQPLNIISMVMDKILFESAKTESITYDFLKNKSDKIFENIIRIKNIIDHVRAFSRNHDDYVLIGFDINSSIENAVSMMVEQFKHLGIKLNLHLGKDLPQIFGNTLKFEQVIVNLLVNAKDAVIEKKNKKDENLKMAIAIRSYEEDRFLIVEVTDNGIGIMNEDIDNLILPFYTTKDEGKGTGLGLSICYQIIKDMGGTIDISSDKLNGTKINLILNIQSKN